MSPQNTWIRAGIVTLAAFVWLFSTVRFQMCPQVACLRRSIVTLVTFVWLFSTVRSQMFPQIACMRRSIVALVAFVWLFSVVHFKMTSQAAFHRGCILTFVALVWFFSFISPVSQGNIFIEPTFTKVIIHHHQVANVVSCDMSVLNWEHVDLEERTNESESHCTICWTKFGKMLEIVGKNVVKKQCLGTSWMGWGPVETPPLFWSTLSQFGTDRTQETTFATWWWWIKIL